jgi:hypothetical protein
MAGDNDFQRRLDVIERGIRELEMVADPGVRALVQQLVQAVMEIHGRSLERLLEVVHEANGSGASIIDRLGRDPVVGPLLVLHSLHPQPLDARVIEALETLRPALVAKRAHAELSSVTDGKVRIRLIGGPDQKRLVERAILEAAPDAASVEIEGGDVAFVGFVAVDSLRGAGAARRLA